MENDFIRMIPKRRSLKEMFSREEESEIIVRHGHIAITNYHMGDNREFEKSLSVWDKISFKYHLVGGYYVKALHEFRINRGYNLSMLHHFFPNLEFKIDNNPYDRKPCKMKLTTPPRSDFQKVALTFMAGEGKFKANKNYSQIMIDADTGDGKAQPDDTIIPTPDGMKRLDQLQIGDMVYNLQGLPVPVTGIFPQDGPQITYKITFEDGRTTRCNGEHLWYADRGNGDEVISTYRLIEEMLKGKEITIPLPNPMKYASVNTPLHPFHYGRECIRTGSRIHPMYIYNDEITRNHVICGIMSQLLITYTPDGFIHINDIPTPELAEDVITIVRSLGDYAMLTGTTVSVRRTKTKWNAKLQHAEPIKRQRLAITSIQLVEDTMQRCIMIDDPLHVYITENYIPTHNTYCGVAITAYHEERAVIIVPFSKLIDQWKEAFTKFTTLEEDDIMVVKGTKSCEKILAGKTKDKKIFIVMVDTLASARKTLGDLKIIDMLNATQASIKIVDEIHRDMKSICMIEALSNFKRNYYMSASPGRAEQKENWIFKTLFYNVPRFGSGFKTKEEKHINIMVKKYYFTPDVQQSSSIINRRVGMNTRTYEKVLATAKPEQQQSFNNALRDMIAWAKRVMDPDCRILILAQTIDFLHYIKNQIDDIFPEEVALYHGSLKPSEKEDALNHKVIVATVGSLGTGADIADLQFTFNVMVYSNWLDAMQISGRLRKKENITQCYCELVNYGWYKTIKQYEKRKTFLLKRSRTGKIVVIN